ncbi:hypothetical protein BpHYR1_004524 [Brachionus plicatilis]|uniref:Uncharacterized protein n=1 Tax=Brachionus plicatilis TaxID=10195 RepID=A0A3M7SIR5_BRAPC|nr:hypothetical protein BpHYR1_004524 [Brachionus plicatilis]
MLVQMMCFDSLLVGFEQHRFGSELFQLKLALEHSKNAAQSIHIKEFHKEMIIIILINILKSNKFFNQLGRQFNTHTDQNSVFEKNY